MYDISKRQTFESVERWLKELKDHADNNIKVMLVGNKSDLRHLRAVPASEGMEFSKGNHISFIETSALDATNVEAAFTQIIRTIYDKVSTKPLDARVDSSFAPSPTQTITISPPPQESKSRKTCC